jgi:isopenicillin-N epimerase
MARPPGKSPRPHRSVEPERVNSLDQPLADPALWTLDPAITFLNHGSFGACPRAVLEHQSALRAELEREPVQFLVREFEHRLDAARLALARFVGAPSNDLVFVPNATGGLNTVLRSLTFKPGDEFLVTDHEYNASRNVLDFCAAKFRAKVVVARIPFPIASPAHIEEAILSRVSRRTRLAMLDHVTSQTGLILPIQSLVRELERRDIRVLVDGAHAPGMVSLNLRRLGASYYTGNCHKWICAPKGAAFLYVRPDRQNEVRPLIVSHGANSPRKDRSRFQLEFGWTGTGDPTAVLSIPAALDFFERTIPGAWPKLRECNHALAVAGRKLLCEALDIAEPCPARMIGALASVPIADSPTAKVSHSPLYLDDLQESLFDLDKIEVPIIPWPNPPKRLLRISAHAYNSLPQYEKLAARLRQRLAAA